MTTKRTVVPSRIQLPTPRAGYDRFTDNDDVFLPLVTDNEAPYVNIALLMMTAQLGRYIGGNFSGSYFNYRVHICNSS